MPKTRYALCGLSTRGVYHFVLPLLGKNWPGGTNFNDRAELVGILDLDEARVRDFLKKVDAEKIPYFPADALPKMIAQTKPDVVLVVGPDYTHCGHVVGALEGGCDAIVEKPMVINTEQVRRVRAAEAKSGRRVRVAFNYRYTPLHKAIKRAVMTGKVGRVTSVEFTYNLDTFHGSSYFYRWNRERAKSGGLNIHKCCHHFDLANWWLGDAPAEVFGYGALNYYGKDGAIRPRGADGRPLDPAEEKRRCPIFQRYYADKVKPETNEIVTGWDSFGLRADAQYPPDRRRYIYDDAIDIEDTYTAVVRYRGGLSMIYSCNFCTPWEGYTLGINGTAGRIEVVHRGDPDPTGKTSATREVTSFIYYPLFGGKEIVEIPLVAGGHGGADFQIQNDLFGPEVSADSRELSLVAGSEDGARAIALGEGMWRSIVERRPIVIDELLAGESARKQSAPVSGRAARETASGAAR